MARPKAYFIGKFFLQVQATVPQLWDSPRGFKFKGRKRQLITHSLSGKPGSKNEPLTSWRVRSNTLDGQVGHRLAKTH